MAKAKATATAPQQTPAPPSQIDPRIQALNDYADHLHEAQNAATSLQKAVAINDELRQVIELKLEVLNAIFETDDGKLAPIKNAIDAENKKLQDFSKKIKTTVDDFNLAAKLVGDLGKIASIVAFL